MSLDAQRTAETTDPVCSTIRMMFPGPLIGGTRSWWGEERRVTHLRELRGSYTARFHRTSPRPAPRHPATRAPTTDLATVVLAAARAVVHPDVPRATGHVSAPPRSILPSSDASKERSVALEARSERSKTAPRTFGVAPVA